MFFDTSRGSFPVCLCVSDCVSLCLCTWSKWEPTPYALQMSSCLIINPAFHAYVNFIITDTFIHSEGCTHVHMHTRIHPHPSFSKLPQLKSSRIKRQLSLISLYLRHLFPPLTLSRLCHFTHFFPPFFPCASLSLFPTQTLSHLCLCLLYLPARETLLQREVMFFFCFIFMSHFWRVHFF